MSILTPETKEAGFWYELIRLSDTQEKQVELAQKIAGLFALVDGDFEPEITEIVETPQEATDILNKKFWTLF